MIEAKDILGWCFTVAAITFGVFGFVYSTYAMAMFQLTPTDPIPPPITRYLKFFCRAVALVLVVLTVVSGVVSFNASVGYSIWAIVLCFVLVTALSAGLAYKMD